VTIIPADFSVSFYSSGNGFVCIKSEKAVFLHPVGVRRNTALDAVATHPTFIKVDTEVAEQMRAFLDNSCKNVSQKGSI